MKTANSLLERTRKANGYLIVIGIAQNILIVGI